MAIATGVIGIGALVGVVVWRGLDHKPPPSGEAAAEVKVERRPESRAVTPSGPEPPPPEVPRETVYRLTGLPQGAIVRIDGRAATVPLTVPRGSTSHTLTVEADGYEGWERRLDATADQTIALQLRKKAAPARSASSSPSRSRHRSEHGNGSNGFVGFSDL
jgi:hypothetical protein